VHALALATDVPGITVWPVGLDGDSHQWTLRCGPPGGTLPDAAAACRKLGGSVEAFRPTPADLVCTQIYGGPEVARVVGRVGTRRVWTTFRRRDGCEIARWSRAQFLLR